MARLLALLAIGVPLFIVVAVRIYVRTGGVDGIELALVGLIGAVAILYSFVAFGVAAIIAAVLGANPRGGWWRLARRIGLGFFGLLCSFYGFRALLAVIDEPTLFRILVISALLLTFGFGSLLVLWNDVCPPPADPESDQP